MLSGTPSHALKKPKWGKPTKTKTKNKREKKCHVWNFSFKMSQRKNVFVMSNDRGKTKARKKGGSSCWRKSKTFGFGL